MRLSGYLKTAFASALMMVGAAQTASAQQKQGTQNRASVTAMDVSRDGHHRVPKSQQLIVENVEPRSASAMQENRKASINKAVDRHFNENGDGFCLTRGESNALRKILGDRIDTDNVRLHFFEDSGRHFSTSYESQGGILNINFFGKDLLTDDFTKGDSFREGLFIRETLALVLGDQLKAGDPYSVGSKYSLNPRIDIEKLSANEQLSVLTDFYLAHIRNECAGSIYNLHEDSRAFVSVLDTKATELLKRHGITPTKRAQEKPLITPTKSALAHNGI